MSMERGESEVLPASIFQGEVWSWLIAGAYDLRLRVVIKRKRHQPSQNDDNQSNSNQDLLEHGS